MPTRLSRSTTTFRALQGSVLVLAVLTGACRGGRGADDSKPATPVAPIAIKPTPTPAATPAPTPTPPPAVAPLGVNLTFMSYWSGERSFSNLMAGDVWRVARWSGGGWKDMAADRIDANDVFTTLAGDEYAVRVLVQPQGARQADVRVRCTWAGKGSARVAGGLDAASGNNSFEFTWGKGGSGLHFVVDRTDPSDPIRQVDCREKAAASGTMFDPTFIASLKPFKVVRFLDWQNANGNGAMRWATRTLPGSTSQVRPAGVSVEHMVALANEAGVDPWFTISWNADEEYVTKFAQYVHANLAAGRKVYVETSNEVWNFGFPVATQAQTEGLARGLSTDLNEARMRRHAEQTTWMMKIFARVFADNPGRLVRVLAGQNGWTALNEFALSWKDTAANIDAFATAPYFGHDVLVGENLGSVTLDQLYTKLNRSADESIASFAVNKTLAAKYGKRYIAYEAGQHVTGNGEWVGRINRDPRMYDVYKRYIRAWRAATGDLMMLYSSITPLGDGQFGLSEYLGQPLSETPKRRAAEELANAS